MEDRLYRGLMTCHEIKQEREIKMDLVKTEEIYCAVHARIWIDEVGTG